MISKKNIKNLILSTIAAVFVLTLGAFFANSVAAQEITIKNLIYGDAQTNTFNPLIPQISNTLVISEIYGGAGCGTAGCSTFRNDYIELYNRGTTAVNIKNYSVQYAAATGAAYQITVLATTDVFIQPGDYYLIAESFGANGANNIPTPDVTGIVAMSATAAKIALVSNSTALSGVCPTDASIIDFVGYGATASCREPIATGTTANNAPSPSTTTADVRLNNGNQDTDNNAADFAAIAPNPRAAVAPTITSANNTTFILNTSGSFQVTATGAPIPTFTATGTLPTGVTLSSFGLLSGTPTQSGTFTFTITAANGVTPNAAQTFTLTVTAPNSAPTITATPAAQTVVSGASGTSTIAITDEDAANVTLTAVSNNTALVPNANIAFGGSGASRTLTATSVAGQTGTAVITVTATDAGGLTGTATFTLTVNAPTIAVAPASLPNGTAGAAYSQTITATGGAANYTFAVTAGSLPTGLMLLNGGVLSGTPTEAGTFNFTVTATDANGFTGSRAYSVTINAGDATAPVISYAPLPAKQNGSTSTLIVTVTDNVQVQSVSIVYAIGNGTPLTANCAVHGGDTYSCVISETGANGQIISYYVTAIDSSNNSSSLPAANVPNGYAVGSVAVQGGTYTNLNINGGALGGAVTVLGTFSFNNLLGGSGNTLRIGCDGQIVRGSISAVIDGTVRKDLCAAQTFVFPVGTATQISSRGGINTAVYTPVTAVVTAAANASSLTVGVTDTFMPGSNPGSSVSRYWSLTETGALTADLSFTYDGSDVNGSEATYKVIKNANGTTSIFNDSTNNETTNTATVAGISDFSLWSVGALAPTAATVDISGGIRNARGRGLEYVNVTLSGGSLSEPITFTTDISGRFRFTDIPANETYILTVRSKRYRFSQPTRVFSVNGNLTNISFVSEN